MKSKRSGQITLVLLFFFSLLWSLGAFIVWTLGSAIAYFAFLYFYYKPRPVRQVYEAPVNAEGGRSVNPVIKRLLFTTVALTVFMMVIFMVADLFSGEDISSASAEESGETIDLSNINDLTDVGNRFYENQQYDSALYYYDKVLAIEPRNSTAFYNKGLVYYNQQNYSRSIEALQKCLNQDADNKDAFFVMGHNYYDQQHYDQALTWYKRAYDAGTRDAFLSHALGFLYDNNSNTIQAIYHYKEALQMDSTRADIYTRLAELEPSRSSFYRKKAEQWKQ